MARVLASKDAIPARKSSNGVLSPRLFLKSSPSAKAPNGFLFVASRFTSVKVRFKQTASRGGDDFTYAANGRDQVFAEQADDELFDHNNRNCSTQPVDHRSPVLSGFLLACRTWTGSRFIVITLAETG
jgi:hypothetical protein